MFSDIRHFVELKSYLSDGTQTFTSLVGIGSSEEWANDNSATVAFATFKDQNDYVKSLLGEEYYVDAFAAIADSSAHKAFVAEAKEASLQADTEGKFLATLFKGD